MSARRLFKAGSGRLHQRSSLAEIVVGHQAFACIEMDRVKTETLHSIHEYERRQGLTVRGNQILRPKRKLADGAKSLQQLAKARKFLRGRGQQLRVTAFQLIDDLARLCN